MNRNEPLFIYPGNTAQSMYVCVEGGGGMRQCECSRLKHSALMKFVTSAITHRRSDLTYQAHPLVSGLYHGQGRSQGGW